VTLRGTLIVLLAYGLPSICSSQTTPSAEKPITGILQAFDDHDVVMMGEIHGNNQEYEFLHALIATPAFDERVDDIVMEVGNSLYQAAVDHYVKGDNIPLSDVEGAWRNTIGLVGPPPAVYESFYKAVREVNLQRRKQHQLRIICGDPGIDWATVRSRDQIDPFLRTRDQFYTQAVETQVLAKHHRALLIAGSFHFLRNFEFLPGLPASAAIEEPLRKAGAKPYLIVFGTNGTDDRSELNHNFDQWHAPVLIPLGNNWVGDLEAIPIVTGRSGGWPELSLKDAADALLYLGPRNTLTTTPMSTELLEGSAYGAEIIRRMKIQGVSVEAFTRNELRIEHLQFP